MNRLYLSLEDGTVFEGKNVGDANQTTGLLSFYTGVVGYQEIITYPGNLGKIVLFTYPLIGNYGVNPQDAESESPKVQGIVTKEYPPYYSNFRATGSLADYLKSSGTVFGTDFDTRAILLHMREHGEMMATFSHEPVSGEDVKERASALKFEYIPENHPIACAMAHARVKAKVVDFGASKSFYRMLAESGVDACCSEDQAELIIISNAPYYTVENNEIVDKVKSYIGAKPVIGFGHGSSLVAKACGGNVRRMPFGDHGVNIPVRFTGGGRNEITVQNHLYEVVPGGDIECIFTNIHDGACEGFRHTGCKAAGTNFMPAPAWFDLLLKSVGVN